MAAGDGILVAGALVLVLALGAGSGATAGEPGPESGPEPDQPFARGLPPERGSEVAVSLAGIPANLASTVWGPGQLDSNLWIAALEGQPAPTRRGPHDLAAGAFALAGCRRRDFPVRLAQPRLAAEFGPYGNDRFARLAWAATRSLGDLAFTHDLEGTRSGRPWGDLEGSSRFSLALRLGRTSPERDWQVTLLAGREQSDGGSPDPVRPLPPGAPDLHPGDGRRSRRLYLGAGRHRQDPDGSGAWLGGYAGGSQLYAWSTWTGFLRDPVHGDQLAQVDRRAFAGAEGGRRWIRAGGRWEHQLGWQARADRVAAAEVHASDARAPLRPLLQAHADLLHGALYGRTARQLGPRWRSWAGLRVDGRRHGAGPLGPGAPFPGPNGRRQGLLGSPTVGLSCRPGPATTVRLEHSLGFRPGSALRDRQPMTRGAGTDLSLSARPPGPWAGGLTLWLLDLEAEVVPDPAWNAEVAAGRSRRYGLEWVNRIAWGSWRAEASLAWTRARFRDLPAGADRVPGALARSATAGLEWRAGGHSARADLRWCGRYDLSPDGAFRADPQMLLDLRYGRDLGAWSLAAVLHNAFGWCTANREYAYASRLPGEPTAGVTGRHRLAADPQQLRFEAVRRF